MHQITSNDVRQLTKYNIKNNRSLLLNALLKGNNSNYHVSWVNGNKVLLRKGKTDILVFKKIFIDREYDFKFPAGVRTIIDAGANIGLSAIFLATKFPNATVIAVEPEQSNFNLMLENIRPYANIIPVQGGISNESGTFRLTDPDADHWNFKLEKCADGQSYGQLYSVPEIMDKYGITTIDFFKIDIEGGEEVLFRDNYQWLSKTRSLSIELHDFIIPRSSNNFFKALSVFAPFSFINYGENHFITFA